MKGERERGESEDCCAGKMTLHNSEVPASHTMKSEQYLEPKGSLRIDYHPLFVYYVEGGRRGEASLMVDGFASKKKKRKSLSFVFRVLLPYFRARVILKIHSTNKSAEL